MLLEALDFGFVQPVDIVRWADERIATTDKPPAWLIDLSILKPHREDIAALLREHAAPLPVRRKIELIALAWDRRLLGLQDALPLLFRITILERGGAPRESIEEPLHDALVEWDSQEDLDVLQPELRSRLETTIRQFLTSAADIGQLVPYGGQQLPKPDASPSDPPPN